MSPPSIVLRDGAALDADELRAFLDGRIAKHKIPATIWFRDTPLPRNANGKFLERELARRSSVGRALSSDERSASSSSWRACSTSWLSWALSASMPSNLRSLRRKWAKRTWAGSP